MNTDVYKEVVIIRSSLERIAKCLEYIVVILETQQKGK